MVLRRPVLSFTTIRNSVCRDNSVSIATRYGPDGPEIESCRPVAERSKARICGRSLPGVSGSNPAGGMYVYMLYSKDKRQSQHNRDEVVQKKYREEKNEDVGQIFRNRRDGP